MSVYVDGLTQHPPEAYKDDAQARRVGGKNSHRWCHMMADTDAELHAMAVKIGMKRAWFQGDHYDLTPGRRAFAVQMGAKEVTGRELVALRISRREARGPQANQAQPRTKEQSDE
jgi:hypothetical protein